VPAPARSKKSRDSVRYSTALQPVTTPVKGKPSRMLSACERPSRAASAMHRAPASAVVWMRPPSIGTPKSLEPVPQLEDDFVWLVPLAVWDELAWVGRRCY
jgi:hypothetical protein